MMRRPAPGFTIVEILVAMTLTLAVFAITLPFVRAQTRALGVSAGRLDADQLARYAQRAIDADLRRASADAGQPMIVYAGPKGITFTANLLASDTLDPGASELSAGAATTLTEAWRLSDAAAIPLTTRSFPPQDYLGADGAISHNETISYYLQSDTINGRSDIYVLYRRVNARPAVELLRGLQVPADSAFFSYQRPVSGVLTRIASNRLPLYWDSVAVDSIRAVGLRVAGFNRDRLTGTETIRVLYWTTPLPNAVTRLAPSCGAAPAPSGGVTVNELTGSGSGRYRVTVVWNRSTDDGVGSNDVRQYVVLRRVSSSSVPWATLATIPASGATSYTWDHLLPGNGTYDYGVRAIDCGGVYSAQANANPLTFP